LIAQVYFRHVPSDFFLVSATKGLSELNMRDIFLSSPALLALALTAAAATPQCFYPDEVTVEPTIRHVIQHKRIRRVVSLKARVQLKDFVLVHRISTTGGRVRIRAGNQIHVRRLAALVSSRSPYVNLH